MSALDRFLRYVVIDTQSDEASKTKPSSLKQLELSRLLLKEMEELGLEHLRMDENGNVFGELPATVEGVPAVGLVAHVDTSDAVSGKDVKPRIVRYEGQAFELSPGIVMDPAQVPELAEVTGEELVVTDGTTLLGADDKAGVAEILDAVEQLLASGRPHGRIGIAFCTDEEVGRGTEGFDVPAFGCEYAYTVDGGALGEIEYENFNAAFARVLVQGRSVHPGSAKGVLRNAGTVFTKFHALLPQDKTPETTEGYEGFLHLTDVNGSVQSLEAHYILRDHDLGKLQELKDILQEAAEQINRDYAEPVVRVEIRDSYRNMREKIEPHMHLIHRAKAAFQASGVEPRVIPIRGGTDGAALSFMGLPCPNLSTGGYQMHGVYEFSPVRAFEVMPQVLQDLVCSFAEVES